MSFIHIQYGIVDTEIVPLRTVYRYCFLWAKT